MSSNSFFSYSPQSMQSALDDYYNSVKKGEPLRISYLVNKYKVPYATLRQKIKRDAVQAIESVGRKTYLDNENETLLARWIIKAVIAGLPPTPVQIRNYVRDYFLVVHGIEYTVSQTWLNGFLKRHPFLKARHAQFLTRSSSSVTEQDIRDWHKYVYDYFKSENLLHVLENPSTIYNADETAFQFNKETGLFIGIKKFSYLYLKEFGDSKRMITVLITAGADGSYTKPFLLYPCADIPESIAGPMLKFLEFHTGTWMNNFLFLQYLKNSFVPFLRERGITGHSALFVDNASCHSSIEISQFCENEKVILIALPPNTTFICQPLDVGINSPIKAKWRQKIVQCRADNPDFQVKIQNFHLLIPSVFKEVLKPDIAMSAFKSCGIFPYNADNIKYHRLRSANSNNMIELFKLTENQHDLQIKQENITDPIDVEMTEDKSNEDEVPKYQFDPDVKEEPLEPQNQPKDFETRFLQLLTPEIKQELDDGTFVAKNQSDLIVEKLYRSSDTSKSILKVLPAIPPNKVVKKRNIKREPIISSAKYRLLKSKKLEQPSENSSEPHQKQNAGAKKDQKISKKSKELAEPKSSKTSVKRNNKSTPNKDLKIAKTETTQAPKKRGRPRKVNLE